MAFVRKYNTRFARPIPKNVLRLIRENQVEALEQANDEGADALQPFIEFNLARPKEPHFPCVSVFRRATGRISNESNNPVDSTPEFAIEIADKAESAEEVQRVLEIRAEAVDSIVRTAAQDFDMWGILFDGVPDEVKGLADVEIVEHVYGKWVPAGTEFIQAVALTLRVSLKEA